MTKLSLSGEKYLRSVLDAYPSPVLIADRSLQIHDANRAAKDLLLRGVQSFRHRLCGEILQCVHARESAGGCGTTEFCPNCVLRQTVGSVSEGTKVFRHTSGMKLLRDGTPRDIWFLVTGAPFRYENTELVILTLEDITEIIELRRIIPICSHCRNVRDDANFWQSVEQYLHRYTGVQFSHGICPDCVRKHYPDMAEGGIYGDDASDEDF